MVAVRGWRPPGVRAAGGAGQPVRLRAGAAVLAAAALVVGCGSIHGPAGLSGAGTGAQGPGSAGGSRTEALALARRMLAHLALPASARTVQLRPLPGPLRHPQAYLGSVTGIDLHRVFGLGQRMPAVTSFLLAHSPAGMYVTGNGQAGGSAGAASRSVSYTPRVLPPGIYQAELDVAVVPAAHGGSLLRADAQAIWYPPRAAAEHLNPADFQVVTIRATMLNPAPHAITRTFTSRKVIASVTGLLNLLPAAPPLVVSCPAMAGTYRVTFAASATSPPSAVATSSGCLIDQLSVSGKAQPALLDQGAKLAGLARRLLRGYQLVPPVG